MSKVLKYFEDIIKIPRESGKEEKIADYLENYAKKNNIECKRDRFNNIYMYKNNNSNRTIILQAHSDMVCVSDNNYDFNNGIDYYIEEDYYKAKATSLGADDGIGIAIILAMLEEKEMPNIEVIITTQEETTMIGANNFDYSLIKSNTLISLDGVKEGDIECSSAGMCSLILKKDIEYIKYNDNAYKLTVSGLKGGHSGDDIGKNRINAIKLIGKILSKVEAKELVEISCGEKDNVIPNSGYVVFTSDKDCESVKELLKEEILEMNRIERGIVFQLENIEIDKVINNGKDIINFINKIEDGLLEKFIEDGFPLLSSNFGAINIVDNTLNINISIRSSDINKLEKQLDKIRRLAKDYIFEINIIANKPFFPYKEDSKIRELLADNYLKLYNENANIVKVHACMEGGVLSNNIPNLDICTIAPTIYDYHTTKERVSISSINRVYKWLYETLINFNKV